VWAENAWFSVLPLFSLSRRPPEVEIVEREMIERCMSRRMQEARESVLKSVPTSSNPEKYGNTMNYNTSSDSSDTSDTAVTTMTTPSGAGGSNGTTNSPPQVLHCLQCWFKKASELPKALADKHLELSLARPWFVLLGVHLCNILLLCVLMYSVDRIMTESGEVGDFAPRLLRIVRDDFAVVQAMNLCDDDSGNGESDTNTVHASDATVATAASAVAETVSETAKPDMPSHQKDLHPWASITMRFFWAPGSGGRENWDRSFPSTAGGTGSADKYGSRALATQDIFTPKNVQSMCRAERFIVKAPNYGSYCRLGSSADSNMGSGNAENAEADTTSHSDPRSCLSGDGLVSEIFYGRNHKHDCPLLDSTMVAQARALLYAAALNPDPAKSHLRAWASYFLQKGWTDSDSNTGAVTGSTTYTRSFIAGGAPLQGFSNAEDRIPEQNAIYVDHLQQALAPMFRHFVNNGVREIVYDAHSDTSEDGSARKAGEPSDKLSSRQVSSINYSELDSPFLHTWADPQNPDVEIQFWSESTMTFEWARMVWADCFLLIFAGITMFLFMSWHTSSVFVTFCSLFQTMMALIIGILVYKKIFGYQYFGSLNLCAMFLAFGIGVDNEFVFVDSWREARRTIRSGDESDSQALRLLRLQFAYRRTFAAVFKTSATTGIGFLTLTASHVMQIASLGVYTALVIGINYIFTLLLFPAVISAYEVHFMGGDERSKFWIGKCVTPGVVERWLLAYYRLLVRYSFPFRNPFVSESSRDANRKGADVYSVKIGKNDDKRIYPAVSSPALARSKKLDSQWSSDNQSSVGDEIPRESGEAAGYVASNGDAIGAATSDEPVATVIPVHIPVHWGSESPVCSDSAPGVSPAPSPTTSSSLSGKKNKQPSPDNTLRARPSPTRTDDDTNIEIETKKNTTKTETVTDSPLQVSNQYSNQYTNTPASTVPSSRNPPPTHRSILLLPLLLALLFLVISGHGLYHTLQLAPPTEGSFDIFRGSHFPNRQEHMSYRFWSRLVEDFGFSTDDYKFAFFRITFGVDELTRPSNFVPFNPEENRGSVSFKGSENLSPTDFEDTVYSYDAMRYLADVCTFVELVDCKDSSFSATNSRNSEEDPFRDLNGDAEIAKSCAVPGSRAMLSGSMECAPREFLVKYGVLTNQWNDSNSLKNPKYQSSFKFSTGSRFNRMFDFSDSTPSTAAAESAYLESAPDDISAREKFKLAFPTKTVFLQKLKNFRREPIESQTRVSESESESASSAPDSARTWANYIGFIDGKLRYLQIGFRSSLLLEFANPYKYRRPYVEKWTGPDYTGAADSGVYTSHSWMGRIEEAIPGSSGCQALLSNPLISSDIDWAFLVTEFETQTVLTVLHSGVLSVALMFIILLLSSRNLTIAVISLVTICAVVFSIAGFFRWAMTWELGKFEYIYYVAIY